MALSPAIAQKSPALHYFYNSGWLAETQAHILVFDFIPHAPAGISMATLAKRLESAGDKKIIVLISHDHQDHFDPAIFDLPVAKEKISFLLGWDYKNLPAGKNVSIILPHDSLIQHDYSVYTHTATDDGSGFLIKTDGLNIYHAGDHALWAEQITDQFVSELHYIKTKTAAIDLAFLPAARGMFTQCAYDSVIEKGIRLGAEILKPAAIAVQHIGCEDKLTQYGKIPAALNSIRARWITPDKYNQSF